MIEILKLLSNEDKVEILRRILQVKTKLGIVTLDDKRTLSLIEEKLQYLPKAA